MLVNALAFIEEPYYVLNVVNYNRQDGLQDGLMMYIKVTQISQLAFVSSRT